MNSKSRLLVKVKFGLRIVFERERTLRPTSYQRLLRSSSPTAADVTTCFRRAVVLVASPSVSLMDLPGEAGAALEAFPSTIFLVACKPFEGELERECVLLRTLVLRRLLLFVAPAMNNPNPWMRAAFESKRPSPSPTKAEQFLSPAATSAGHCRG